MIFGSTKSLPVVCETVGYAQKSEIDDEYDYASDKTDTLTGVNIAKNAFVRHLDSDNNDDSLTTNQTHDEEIQMSPLTHDNEHEYEVIYHENDSNMDGPSTLYALVMYKYLIYQEIRHSESSRRSLFHVCMWQLAGLCTSSLTLLTLMSVNVSLMWGECNNTDDCKAGQACVRYQEDDGFLNKPTCEDCSFFIGPDAWEHVLPPTSYEPTEQVCLDMVHTFYLQGDFEGLYEPNGGLLPVPEEYPSQCVYVQDNFMNSSRLDIFILYVVVIIIAAEIGVEAVQHETIRTIRQYCMGLKLRENTTKESWGRFFLIVITCLSEMMQSLILAVLPMTFAMLTVTDDVNAVNLILNGLSITFFLYLDDLLIHLIVDEEEKRKVANYMGKIHQTATEDKEHPEHECKKENYVYAFASCFMCFFAFYGIRRAENCEVILYWLNYRIVIQFGVWFVSIFMEVIDSFHLLCHWYGHKQELSTSSRWPRVFQNYVFRIFKWFLSTVLIAFLQNVILWLATTLYYDIPLAVSFSESFWPETSDVFGACARIGWDSSFPCSSPWPFPGKR